MSFGEQADGCLGIWSISSEILASFNSSKIERTNFVCDIQKCQYILYIKNSLNKWVKKIAKTGVYAPTIIKNLKVYVYAYVLYIGICMCICIIP